MKSEPITIPCLCVEHVDTYERLKTLRDALAALVLSEPTLMRRGDNVGICDGGNPLVTCEEASPHVALDADGAMDLTWMLLRATERALLGTDSMLIRRLDDMLRDVGRMIAGQMPDETRSMTEIMVECPLPWRPHSVVRRDQQSGIGLWGDVQENLSAIIPAIPAIVQFSTVDGRIHARGWGRRVILVNDRPDVMETLRLTACVPAAAERLMDAASGTR